ncbi:YggT family protein [Bombella sp. ESL0378]|nr:YggT family protein [Bombella sp. ESL0378]MUG89314.1 YggT family protein [Bombella sp. ESL0385]
MFIVNLILMVLDIYTWIILAYCFATMAINFDVIDPRSNRFIQALTEMLARLVEPVLQPIRNILPPTGIMDFSPLVLLLTIQYAPHFIFKTIFKLVFLTHA